MVVANENIVAFVGSTEGLRQRNRALVLSAVRALEQAKHAAIAERSRLSAGTVSTVLAELVEEEILLAGQGEKKGRGRPTTSYSPNPEIAKLAHVRITAEAVTFSLLDFTGRLVDLINQPRQAPSVESFLHTLQDGLTRLANRANVDLAELSWILFTSKALLNQEDGRMLWSPVLGSQHVDLEAHFPQLKGRISLRHEACSIAEHSLLEARAADQKPNRVQAVLQLGNSVGFGIAERQATGYVTTRSPALAHMNFKPQGNLCRCGGRGCVEAHAGFHAILRAALEGPELQGAVPAVPVDQIRQLAKQARAGHQLSILAFRDAGAALGNGLAHLFMVTGVMPLLITGPGTEFFDLLEPSLRHELDQTLLARLGQSVEFRFALNEEKLLIESAIDSCIQDFDSNVVATRKHRPNTITAASPNQDSAQAAS